ncbi:olfactory receptor 10V1-like [Pelodytes ibericus]
MALKRCTSLLAFISSKFNTNGVIRNQMGKHNQTLVTQFIFKGFSGSTTFQRLVFTGFLFIYMVILLVNGLLIVVIKVDQALHTPMYFLIFNLCCLDIFYTSTVVPQTLKNLLSSIKSISFFQCAAQMFFIVTFGGTTIFIITAMAYDRYVAISNPLRYTTVINWNVCKLLIAIIWILSSMIAVTMVFSIFLLPFCEPLVIDHFYCDVAQVFHLTCATVEIHDMVQFLYFFLGVCLFTIPFLLVAVSYIYIISAILKIRTNEGRRKAFYTCSSHLTIVVVEYACLGFINFRTDVASSANKTRVFTVIVLFATPLLNPLIYSVRNKAVKNGFIKCSSCFI